MRRFEQVKRLYKNITQNYTDTAFTEITLVAITAAFDQLFELSWKVLKEYLYSVDGIREAKTGSPSLILKLAYREGLINNESMWLEMLDRRNDDTHHYNSAVALLYATLIVKTYLPFIGGFIEDMEKLIAPEPNIDEGVIGLTELAGKSGMQFDILLGLLYEKTGYSSIEELTSNWSRVKDVCAALELFKDKE